MNKKETVFSQVKELYQNSTTKIGKWMWNNHVQWVATKTEELANKYKADAEKAYCGALLHDLADATYERRHENFDTWSEQKGEEILLSAGFTETEVKEIIEIIVRPHSCKPDNVPSTLEGKALATADAMFHLQTNFYPTFCYINRPKNTSSYEEWQEWTIEKLERDYNSKIFFDEEKEEVGDDYAALLKVFGNKSLSSPKE